MGVDISYLTVSAHDPFSVCKYIFDAKKNNENISKSAFNKKQNEIHERKITNVYSKNTSRKKKC